MNLYQFIHTIHQPFILHSSLLSRKGKKRDCCPCSMELKNKDLLKEFMDKVFGKALLSLPGKVSFWGFKYCALFAIRNNYSFLSYERSFFNLTERKEHMLHLYLFFLVGAF